MCPPSYHTIMALWQLMHLDTWTHNVDYILLVPTNQKSKIAQQSKQGALRVVKFHNSKMDVIYM